MPGQSEQARRSAAAALAGAAIFFTVSAGAVTPALVAAPPNTQVIESTTASGVQIYTCEFDASHRLGWVFQRPSARLYDDQGRESVHHFAGPAWQARDGSMVVGHTLAQAPSQTPGSIPQLLLKVKSTADKGALSSIHYVQRLDTVGGAAPTGSCTAEHSTGESPYFARYVFLK